MIEDKTRVYLKDKCQRSFKFWTLREVEYLRKAYKTKTEREIAKEMGLTLEQVGSAISRYKILSGRDGRFKKGRVSWNKGKHNRVSPRTEFKDGHLPHNTLHDGAIRIRQDKSGKRYLYIRISLGKWVPLHRYNWEKVNGPIPPRMLLIFKDKNQDNCEVDNLELVTRQALLFRNHDRKKMGATMKEIWRKEKLRRDYGMSPKTGLGKRLKRAA